MSEALDTARPATAVGPPRGGRAVLSLGALAVAHAALIAWLSSQARPPFPQALLGHDKLAHGAGYAVLGALLAATVCAARGAAWRVLVVATLLASAYGVTDEWHQAFVPGRSCDALDWVADTAGALCGAALVTVALRRRGSRASIRG